MSDPVFRIDMPAITHGPGAIRELGAVAASLKLERVMLMTDPTMAGHASTKAARQSLDQAGIACIDYDRIRVEPTDQSLLEAVDAARENSPDGFVSIGGGSVIDTTKAANLYSTYPAPFLDFVNAPVGKGKLVPGRLKPHIAIPTTCGTGSEVTGICVFDLLAMKAKTGIMSRRMVPDHAIVDPQTVTTLPPLVLAATALDLLCHALEAFSCKPASSRMEPKSPDHRPMTQGSNSWSDFVALQAITLFQDNFEKAVQGDLSARGELLWAATLAGNAFGNAGCHVPHALSYPVSGMVRDYHPDGYPKDEPMVPPRHLGGPQCPIDLSPDWSARAATACHHGGKAWNRHDIGAGAGGGRCTGIAVGRVDEVIRVSQWPAGHRLRKN